MSLTRPTHVDWSIPRHPAIAYRLDDGEEAGSVIVVPELTADLPGGFTGYYQRTFDDCLLCSVATCLQIPYEELDISEQDATRETVQGPLLRFAKENRLELRAHSPEEPPDHRWIAISPPLPQHQGDPVLHVFVAKGAEVFFDPWNFRRLDGSLYTGTTADSNSMAYGFSLHPERNN